MSDERKPFWWHDHDEYRKIRCQGDLQSQEDFVKKFGRGPTEPERWALYDNGQDQKLIDMGR